MKVVICMFFLVVAVAQAGGCVMGNSRTDQEVDGLINAIKKTPFPNEKIVVLLQSLKMSQLGFTGNQTVAVFESLGIAAWSTDSVDAMYPYILNLQCQDLSRLIGTVPIPNDKLSMLKKYIPLTIDLNQNNATLIEAFPGFDKADAQKIIDNTKGGTCLFGYGLVEAKRVTLVVDKSRYMGLSSKKILQYVKEQLNMAVDSMTDDQLFNVVYFVGGVSTTQSGVSRQWPGVVPHNATNVQTVHTTFNKMKDDPYNTGLPDIRLALSVADDPNAYAIFLFSAGIHSHQQQDIIDFASKYSSTTDSKGTPRVIHTVAFKSDGFGDDANFMSEVAKAGRGTFRSVSVN